METKKCKYCNEIKSLDRFTFYVKRDGTKGYRSKCKDCTNKADRERRKTKNKSVNSSSGKNIIPEKKSPGFKNIEQEEVKINMFTDKEIESLKEMVELYPKLLDLINTRIEIESDKEKTNRIPRTINMNNTIYKKIKDYCRKTNFSISDVVNELLKKSIHFLDDSN